jgi:hypothetical protein
MGSNQFMKKLKKEICRIRMKIKLMIFQFNICYNYSIKIFQKILDSNNFQIKF